MSPPTPTPASLDQRLVAPVQRDQTLMQAERAVRTLGLECWCIGAGVVRNLVWDALHGYAKPSALNDLDVAYFDPARLEPDDDAQLQRRLREQCPQLPWEVTNQAAVHRWYASVYGHPMTPYCSLEQAVGSWPEYATAVGVSLGSDDVITVIAPHGLDDLFHLRARHNPALASQESYRQRVADKRYSERWPQEHVEL